MARRNKGKKAQVTTVVVRSTKSPKKSKSRNRNRKPRMTMAGNMPLAMQICSVTNPFCDEARGARWPDNSYTKSAGWSYFGGTFGIGTDATGSGALMMFPDPYNNSMSPTSITTGTIAWPTNMGSSFTAPSNIARYRVTSFGFRLSATQTPLSAQGMVRVRHFSPMLGASLSSTDISSINADAAYDVPLARLINQDLFVIPMPLGDNARLFSLPVTAASALASWSNPGWQVTQIGITGATASTQVLSVAVYYNYELIFNDGDAANMFEKAPPPTNLQVQRGNADVLASIGNFAEGTSKKVDSIVQSSALKYAAAGVAGYFGGSSAAMAVYNGVERLQNWQKYRGQEVD